MWIIAFCWHDESLVREKENVLLWRTEVGTSLETEGMREFALLSISTGCLEVNTTGFSPELGYGVNPARL